MFCSFFFSFSLGNISLPEIFSDNMVLQQKSDVILWGWAKTGEKVTVKADWMDAEISTQGRHAGNMENNFENASQPAGHIIFI